MNRSSAQTLATRCPFQIQSCRICFCRADFLALGLSWAEENYENQERDCPGRYSQCQGSDCTVRTKPKLSPFLYNQL